MPKMIILLGTSLFCGSSARAEWGAVPSVVGVSVQDAVIARSVLGLGSDRFQEREDAERSLVDMGRPALPALQAAMGSEDPEVRLRAGRARQAIFNQVTANSLLPEAALRQTEALQRDLETANASFPNADVSKDGEPTPRWLAQQEERVKAADQLLRDLGMSQAEIRTQFNALVALGPRASPAQKRNLNALFSLLKIRAAARLNIARAHSLSDTAEKRGKAVDYLVQVISIFPEDYMRTGPTWDNSPYSVRMMETDGNFAQIATRAGAFLYSTFTDALPAASKEAMMESMRRYQLEPRDAPGDFPVGD